MYATARQDARVIEETYGDFKFQVFNFLGAAKQVGDGGPQAYLASVPPRNAVQSHFHPVDQFQVFFGCDGAYFERHAITGVHVQYSDAYTPYGPFGAGDTQLNFYTLRAQATADHHTMPGARARMQGRRGKAIQAPVVRSDAAGEPVTMTPLFEPQPSGVAAYHLMVAPGHSAVAPSPQGSGGQYFIVIAGTMNCSAGAFPYQSCLFREPHECGLQMQASADEGFEVLVLQFRCPVAE